MKDEFTFEHDNKYCITVRHNDFIIARLKCNKGCWYCMAKMLLSSFEMRTIADRLDDLNGG